MNRGSWQLALAVAYSDQYYGAQAPSVRTVSNCCWRTLTEASLEKLWIYVLGVLVFRLWQLRNSLAIESWSHCFLLFKVSCFLQSQLCLHLTYSTVLVISLPCSHSFVPSPLREHFSHLILAATDSSVALLLSCLYVAGSAFSLMINITSRKEKVTWEKLFLGLNVAIQKRLRRMPLADSKHKPDCLARKTKQNK